MSQYYKMPGFSLANANASTKVLLTLFLITVLLGLGVALLQYYDRASFSATGAEQWMLGNEGEESVSEFKSAKTYRELLAITHDHAFALPMLLFILLHLVALCRIGEKPKIALYVVGFLSLVASLGGPWLVRYQGPEWSLLLRVGGFGLTGTIAASSVICLFELWLAKSFHRWRRRPEPPASDPLVRSRRAEGLVRD